VAKQVNYPPARRTAQCFQFNLQVATWTRIVFSRKPPESNNHGKLSRTKKTSRPLPSLPEGLPIEFGVVMDSAVHKMLKVCTGLSMIQLTALHLI
jgi:hypothetical protein